MSESLDRALTFAASALGVYLLLAILQVVLTLFVTIRSYFQAGDDRKLVKEYIKALEEKK